MIAGETKFDKDLQRSGRPVAILAPSVEHPSQLLRLSPHLALPLPATSGSSLASESWISLPQVTLLFMCCSVSGVAYIRTYAWFNTICSCWNLMETPPQQQGPFSPWVQPASERAATRLESGNLTTCSRFRLPRQDHLDDPTEIWKALTWLCDPHQNSDPIF